jgi:hypothetical protein
MDNSMNPQNVAGQNFGPGASTPQLPTPLSEKIQLASRLLEEINRDLELSPLGPGGIPVISPGIFPTEQIPESEIEKIRDAIHSGTRLFKASLRIADVEMTQSTQFFNFDNLSSGAGYDNSVPLITNKVLVLRVYVEKTSGFGAIPDLVTGRVHFGGQEFQPLNGPLRPQERRLVRRSNWNDTLNFRIPAELCRGNRTFRVRVFDAAAVNPLLTVGIYADGSAMRFVSTSKTFIASFQDVPPLRVMGVMVNYGGPPNFDLPAPPGLSLVETLTRFLPMYPIHGFDFGPCVVQTWGDDMRIQSGQKFSGWDSLLNQITNLRSSSTVRAFYVGLLPANLSGQLGSNQRGIGRPGAAIAAKDDTRALSHELGHALKLDHINAGGAKAPFDGNYPKYREGTFPFGSIGEFGLDTTRLTLFAPSTASDMMTYLDAADVPFPSQTWLSPYNYQKMMNALVESDGTGDFPATTAASSAMMLLNFRLYRDGKVELLPSYPVDGIDRNGEVLRSHHCHEHNPYQDPDGPFVDFHEVMTWSAEVARLAFVKEGKTFQTIDVDEYEPEIQLKKMRRVQKNGDLARLEWAIGSTTKVHQALIRYSHDDGQTWQAVAAGVTGSDHSVNLDLLPGGEKCRLQVIVSSGLRGAMAQTEPFAVPHKPREAHIVSPRDGQTYKAGASVTFTGGGYSPDGGTCAFDEVAWHSSIDGLLGTGYQLVRNDLRPGMHRITLSLPDGDHGEAAASIWIKIAEEDDAPADCA